MPEADMKGKKAGPVVEKQYFKRQVLSQAPNTVANSLMTSPKISAAKNYAQAQSSKHLNVNNSVVVKMPKIASE